MFFLIFFDGYLRDAPTQTGEIVMGMSYKC